MVFEEYKKILEFVLLQIKNSLMTDLMVLLEHESVNGDISRKTRIIVLLSSVKSINDNKN